MKNWSSFIFSDRQATYAEMIDQDSRGITRRTVYQIEKEESQHLVGVSAMLSEKLLRIWKVFVIRKVSGFSQKYPNYLENIRTISKAFEWYKKWPLQKNHTYYIYTIIGFYPGLFYCLFTPTTFWKCYKYFYALVSNMTNTRYPERFCEENIAIQHLFSLYQMPKFTNPSLIATRCVVPSGSPNSKSPISEVGLSESISHQKVPPQLLCSSRHLSFGVHGACVPRA